jgi:serine/threonine-protein phosphatase 2B regulatory subunit
VINFREFLIGLSVFSRRGTFEEKMRFSFRVYDVDGDGAITKDEMFAMLSASLLQSPLNLTQNQIKVLIDETFREADKNGDGVISFEEYREMVMAHPNIALDFDVDALTKDKTLVL